MPNKKDSFAYLEGRCNTENLQFVFENDRAAIELYTRLKIQRGSGSSKTDVKYKKPLIVPMRIRGFLMCSAMLRLDAGIGEESAINWDDDSCNKPR